MAAAVTITRNTRAQILSLIGESSGLGLRGSRQMAAHYVAVGTEPTYISNLQ